MLGFHQQETNYCITKSENDAYKVDIWKYKQGVKIFLHYCALFPDGWK